MQCAARKLAKIRRANGARRLARAMLFRALMDLLLFVALAIGYAIST
jgi:hypothetical protein